MNLITDFRIGCRYVRLKNNDNIQEILLQEVQFQQQCTNNSLGILISDELWQDIEFIVDDLEYDIWKLESIANILFPMVSHLLYELPWNGKMDVIDVRASTFEMQHAFLNVAKSEHMCLRTKKNRKFAAEHRIARILIGIEMLNSIENIGESGAIFAVPLTSSDDNYIKSKK